jgi:hypothetical protein
VKESESVEDLQRQINIINQQIANFNSEFSAINTHLNTIDTNILNLQPVDTVASGNLHSVTSNAVANMNSLAMPVLSNVDVFTTAESCLLNKVSFFRIYEASANSPYLGMGNDFYYYVNKLEDNNYIRLMAFDIRSNNVYVCTKVNGSWGSWTFSSNQTGVIYKNHKLRIFFDKPYLATDLQIQVQGVGGLWIRIYWYGGSNGIVHQIYIDSNGFLKIYQLNGNIGSLTYNWGDGFIDILNPNDEIESFIINGSVKSFVVFQ